MWNRFPNILHRKLETNNVTSTYIAKYIPNMFQNIFQTHFKIYIIQRKSETNNATSDQLIACLWKAPNSKSQKVILLQESKCIYNRRETANMNDEDKDLFHKLFQKTGIKNLSEDENRSSVVCIGLQPDKKDTIMAQRAVFPMTLYCIYYIVWLYTVYSTSYEFILYVVHKSYDYTV